MLCRSDVSQAGTFCRLKVRVCSIERLNGNAGEVMVKDCFVREALMAHDGSTDLTHPYAMTPAAAFEAKALRNAALDVHGLRGEGAALEMRATEQATYLQLLTDNYRCAATHDAQARDVPARTTLHGFEA